jgi:predicted YcjX-like family ATPase
VNLLDGFGRGLQKLAAGEIPFLSPSVVRVGVTGLSRAGKTAFLTSVAATLMARRFALAPVGASAVPRFDQARHLASLAGNPPAWPERTNAASLLSLTTSIPRGVLPARHVRLEFLDYPGEWLIDLPMLTQRFSAWSAATLLRLEAPEVAEKTAAFRSFVGGLPSRCAADESLAYAGTQLYRDMLGQLREQGLSFLQPGRHLMPAPGPEPPWMAFFPLTGSGGLAGLLESRYAAYQDAVRRDLASPLFAEVDRLVILADVLTALHAGEAAFADMRTALSAASGALRWDYSWLEAFASLATLRLPPRVISRVAFAATKVDHVADRQRGNLAALMRSLTEVPGSAVTTGHFAIASVRCTEDFVWTLEGRPVSAVRGRVLGQQVMTRSYPGEVPDRPPDGDFWAHPFLALPHFEPMQLPDGGRMGVPNIGLDALLGFLLEDVL